MRIPSDQAKRKNAMCVVRDELKVILASDCIKVALYKYVTAAADAKIEMGDEVFTFLGNPVSK